MGRSTGSRCGTTRQADARMGRVLMRIDHFSSEGSVERPGAQIDATHDP
jgi:hypothetical protein